MSLPRFHCPERTLLVQGGELPRELAHHAVRVLRMGVGEELVLFDGQGGGVLHSDHDHRRSSREGGGGIF